MQFEVFIPGEAKDGFDVRLRIEASNWLQALKLALIRSDISADLTHNIQCDIKADNIIQVTELSTRRVFKIRQYKKTWLPSDSKPQPKARPNQRFRHPREFKAILDANALREALDTPEGQPPKPASHVRKVRASQPTPTTPREPIRRIQLLHKTRTKSDGRAPDGARASTQSKTPKRSKGAVGNVGIRITQTGKYKKIGSREMRAVESAGEAQLLSEHKTPTRELPMVIIDPALFEEQQQLTESALEDLFLEMGPLFDASVTIEAATESCLGLAMRFVPSESGSILFTDATGDSLYFAAARGPKAEALMKSDTQFSVERGIVGFCVRTGVSLALADATNDPRFYGDVAEVLDHSPRAIMCAPVQHEGRCFGAIELINPTGKDIFEPNEVEILSYIGKSVGQFLALKGA